MPKRCKRGKFLNADTGRCIGKKSPIVTEKLVTGKYIVDDSVLRKMTNAEHKRTLKSKAQKTRSKGKPIPISINIYTRNEDGSARSIVVRSSKFVAGSERTRRKELDRSVSLDLLYLGGRHNPNLKRGGPGWIYPATRRAPIDHYRKTGQIVLDMDQLHCDMERAIESMIQTTTTGKAKYPRKHMIGFREFILKLRRTLSKDCKVLIDRIDGLADDTKKYPLLYLYYLVINVNIMPKRRNVMGYEFYFGTRAQLDVIAKRTKRKGKLFTTVDGRKGMMHRLKS